MVAPAPSRRVMSALVAPRLTTESVSRIFDAAIVKAADWVKPATGTTKSPLPVVSKVKFPATVKLLPVRVKSALVAVKLALPPALTVLRLKASLSVTVNNPVPARVTPRLVTLVLKV